MICALCMSGSRHLCLGGSRTVTITNQERCAGEQCAQRGLALEETIDRNTRQCMQVIGMIRKQVPRPRCHGGGIPRLAHKPELARTGRRSISEWISKIAHRTSEPSLKDRLAVAHLVHGGARVVLR